MKQGLPLRLLSHGTSVLNAPSAAKIGNLTISTPSSTATRSPYECAPERGNSLVEESSTTRSAVLGLGLTFRWTRARWSPGNSTVPPSLYRLTFRCHRHPAVMLPFTTNSREVPSKPRLNASLGIMLHSERRRLRSASGADAADYEGDCPCSMHPAGPRCLRGPPTLPPVTRLPIQVRPACDSIHRCDL